MSTKKKELGFDFAEGFGTDDETDTKDQEVVTVRNTDNLNKRNAPIVERQPLVEKSAGPGNTVRRTQQQEESLSFVKGISNRPVDRVIGGLDPVDESAVAITDNKGNRVIDTQHTNK